MVKRIILVILELCFDVLRYAIGGGIALIVFMWIALGFGFLWPIAFDISIYWPICINGGLVILYIVDRVIESQH